ncbi:MULTISPECIES: hypothetical protein [unclassified Caballeronia]|uniref:hypothetical protein n=1 Tax=unclassified Caballeronia TaxID=2646786 RepID=UPI0013EBC00A|nr:MULTISPECIES: hypothetical protein [unclassified Caballeronia]
MDLPDSATVSAIHAHRATRAWLAVIIGFAGVVGGYQFQRILSALPDSNDDFIFF